MSEAGVRAALVVRILARAATGEPERLIHELNLCQAEARIDLAYVGAHLTGWEIKTRSDTLKRLPRQAEVYSRIFDNVWLVADEKHIDAAEEIIPDWWGILRVSGREDSYRIVRHRSSRINRSVDMASLVRLLWRVEVLDELKRLGLDSGMHRAPRAVLWQRLSKATPGAISERQLRSRVRNRLTGREGWRADAPHR